MGNFIYFNIDNIVTLAKQNVLSFGIQTENEGVQAFVRHVFINQHFFFLLNAASKKLYKISVLKLGNQSYFIFELIQSLPRTR